MFLGLDEKTAAPCSGEEEMLSNERIKIKVVGVGGGGCNTINRIAKSGIKSAQTIAINTDAIHLNHIQANKKVLIGKTVTRGLGAGGYPEVAQKCAEISKNEIADAIGESQLVFLCAGMGGGTGTGAAPVVAQVAHAQGAVTIALVTYPFELERARIKKAIWGIQELSQAVDCVIVIDNNRLASYVPNLPMDAAFQMADNITTKAITGISDTIMFPSLINIDYADVKSLVEGSGLALISYGEGRGTDKVPQVVKNVLAQPLLDVETEDAKGALIQINGSAAMTLGECMEIGEKLTANFSSTANVKIGARTGLVREDEIAVTTIMTGVKSKLGGVREEAAPKKLLELENIRYL
ncbi:cell division protein FtsZ [Candidatus Micrarchaeota archaeon CG1_02_49_24]|nr:MAG: cell division protein FtsZ [Candidatus Micrarchaeota archaeon CG1_02_49_24]PIU82544.1 MAG: cell division protein FtsZ [Candidatus Micrarchaeota archaeon CG06_land_8_20_14_3_00_50_6]HII53938.1 cell division protein FtsZ [Candidatus Micrarchaeota archaeon]